ncbi:mitochondrial carrier homolog 1-like isoform X2 [Nelusetta ayraudi]|uniref:mitochondrial carrier homolog 1-like isoform X2 n=1 Tax=Nelusetta ayraudi TaxID=303726 RepID=UPI003F70F5C3
MEPLDGGSEPVPGTEHDVPTGPVDPDTAVLLLSAGVTTITHPLLYVKLLIQVGHEPLPPRVGTTLFGRRVLYLPGFFSYARHIVSVDGKMGLFRGLSPRLLSSAISTVIRCKGKQAELPSKMSSRSSLRKVMKETSHEMMIQCLSRVATHPFHVMSVRCMAQFVGREVKYSGMFTSILTIFQEEGVAGFYVGLVPHMLGEVLFLWCCNLLAHFINTYAVDENVSRKEQLLLAPPPPPPITSYQPPLTSLLPLPHCPIVCVQFSQASAVRSYTKFVMGIAVSVLTYPFILAADITAVNNCGLAVGLPPHSPIFKSWMHCWSHLSQKGLLFRGSSFFFRRVPITSLPSATE